MPAPPTARIRIAILLNAQSSVALAFLLRAVFARANRQLGHERYAVEFVQSGPGAVLALHGAVVAAQAPRRRRYDYFVITPLDGVGFDYEPPAAETALARRQHRRGTIVASACLGVLTLAAAGVLDGREATTHWAWGGVVARRYPRVRWAVGRMVCDLGDVISAGGYLAVVDLALHIVGATSGRATAHAVGQQLLADSARQRQSVYAQTLVEPQAREPRLAELARWIERHLDTPLDAAQMARRCGMSTRSFHRRFVDAYGLTPRKFVQVKRIEKARELLRGTRRSVEQVLESVGVSDVSSFRRVFQRELGCSPAEYRRRLRA